MQSAVLAVCQTIISEIVETARFDLHFKMAEEKKFFFVKIVRTTEKINFKFKRENINRCIHSNCFFPHFHPTMLYNSTIAKLNFLEKSNFSTDKKFTRKNRERKANSMFYFLNEGNIHRANNEAGRFEEFLAQICGKEGFRDAHRDMRLYFRAFKRFFTENLTKNLPQRELRAKKRDKSFFFSFCSFS